MLEMHLAKMLVRTGACAEAREWASGKTLAQAWNECDRADWMLWWAAKLLPRPRVVTVTCVCVRPALRYVEAGEDRPRFAIETAERWARGEAGVTLDDVRAASAASAAASAASAAASASDASYAAYAASAAASASDASYAAYVAAYVAASASSAASYAATLASAAAAVAARRGALARMADLVRAQISAQDIEASLSPEPAHETSVPYRPSCGTEGMDFQEEFCCRCERERLYRETSDGAHGCRILGDTYLYAAADPRYPKEWISDEQGPRCTAFEQERKP